MTDQLDRGKGGRDWVFVSVLKVSYVSVNAKYLYE